MRYALFITRRDDGTYEGSVPLVPEIKERAPTREAAIGAVRAALHTRLSQVEIVTVELPESVATHDDPWQATAGILADDLTLERLLEEIYAARDHK